MRKQTNPDKKKHLCDTTAIKRFAVCCGMGVIISSLDDSIIPRPRVLCFEVNFDHDELSWKTLVE